jgi:hypothetical protein
MFVDFLKLFEVVDMDGSFPMRRYTQSLDLRFKSYEVFKISGIFGHDAVSHCQCNKFCPKLPKAETLKYHQKSRYSIQ